MAFFPLDVEFVLVLWILGFIFMESDNMLTGIICIGCFVLPIATLTGALEYVTETAGIMSTATLPLSTASAAKWVLMDVFFLFMALVNEWFIVTGRKKKPDD